MHDPSDPVGVPVDLTNCAREPIHIPGQVQAFGCLIAVSADWIVCHASANLDEVLGVAADEVIGTRLIDQFPPQTVHLLRSRLQFASSEDASSRVFGLAVFEDDRRFDVSVHVSGANYVFEFEPSSGEPAREELEMVQPLISRVRRAATLDTAVNDAVRGIRLMTGFDRVMIYRFEPDDSGTVIAESADHGMTPYLHLRFPESDIPAQARKLYERSLLRIIPDIEAPTHRLVPEISPDGHPLDLSLAVTRAVSPIHIEYLRNMGVRASMSISILKRGKLWGLIACHAAEPTALDYRKRSALELFAQLFAHELVQFEMQAEAEAGERARQMHNALLSQISSGVALTDSFERIADQIAGMIEYDGIVLFSDGAFLSRGLTPTEDEFRDLARFLNTAAPSSTFITESLASRYPASNAYGDRVAGLLALPISRTPRDYIVLFRREVVKSVRWGGEPRKESVGTGPAGPRISPRQSFEAWTETVRETSAPWTEVERRAAESLRVTLLEVILKLTDETQAANRRAAEQQKLLIAELNHRVRNILNLIRGLVSQGRGEAVSIDEYVQILDTRIHALSRAHDQLTEGGWTWTPLHQLIETEAQAFLQVRSDRLSVEGSRVDLAPQAFTTVALVMHELVTNSAKYGALSDSSGSVRVALDRDENGALVIDWSEHSGPPVQAPTRQGFGTTIIQHSIPYELNGEAEISYDLTGVRARFVVPAVHVRTAEAAPALKLVTPAEGGTPRLSGEALVVEDNMIIAMDAADMLGELGASQVHTASSVDRAMRLLDAGKNIAFAMLDVNLGDHTSTDIAQRCRDEGIPIVLATGYGGAPDVVKSFPDAPIVKKPFTKADLEVALRELGLTT